MNELAKIKTPKKKKGRFNETPGRRRKGGAPRNNRNHMRHGLRGGQLPKDCKYIEMRLNRFRRCLEDALLATRSEVTITDAAIIQTCLRWERHSALAQRWLVKANDELKPVERLSFSREIARASSERDKAIATLKLDEVPKAPWDNVVDGNIKDDK